MDTIQWHATANQFVISIDRNSMGKEELFEMLRWMRMRLLIQKAAFEPEIEALGEEILSDWWEKNQSRFIPAEG